MAPESVIVRPEITTDAQILASLQSTGAGFEGAGGSAHMLTEAVENGVDSIIKARRLGIPTKGRIKVIVDRTRETVEVWDDGMGFESPVHIAKKPFESLKKGDPTQTGRFARGIQGFRAFCGRLTFLTKRPAVPAGETLPDNGASGRTVRLGFQSDIIEVELTVEPDSEWASLTKWPTGAIAIYSDWKRGAFDRIRKDLLRQRLQHHFGELVRQGGFTIEVVDGDAVEAIEPTDYSIYQLIDIPPITVPNPKGYSPLGEIVAELYLMERRRRDPWTHPFLMYRDRPVGDRAIYEIEEFDESVAWDSSYITGFVRCDFCEINELRLALKSGYERDFLYGELAKLDVRLRDVLSRHQKTLFDARMRDQIDQLVIDLQEFLKRKHVFNFRVAQAPGSLAEGTKSDLVPVSPETGTSEATVAEAIPGEPGTRIEGVAVSPAQVTPTPDLSGDGMTHQEQIGGVGGAGADQTYGGPDRAGSGQVEAGGSVRGYTDDGGELNKGRETEAELTPGTDQIASGRGRARRRRPRGFGIKLQDDEFNEELSWYEPTTSSIIINSGHERYKKREGEEAAQVKALMQYLAELYIWEIAKISGRQSNAPPDEVVELFLRTKFEFLEERGTA